ncbi:MAG: SulP family inorganic anion transporter [Bacteroidetes bacterium]|nr:MAG: SulP family inorganic anion transporter [Bacteroidota bacterium]
MIQHPLMKEKTTTFVQNLKSDLPASLVVFLVALPLCLGIGVASTEYIDPESGVKTSDPLVGLISGIIGGIVVTIFSKSTFGVSGPAAGLISIVVGAIAYFNDIDPVNGYSMFLVAVILSGIFQIILGALKLGKMVAFFPGSVIRGMLAAIGIIIILKQIPHAFGFDHDFEGDLAFNEPDGGNTFTHVGNVIHSLFTGSEALTTIPSIIFIVGILLSLVWESSWMKRLSFTKIISAPLLIVVIGGIVVFYMKGEGRPVSQDHLVSFGSKDGINGIKDVFSYFPDFSALKDPRVYLMAITLAIVASLESLLCMEATDKLDPESRHTPPNRELFAQGIGNTIAGFLGGLPVTQVIVRSSANLQSGAKSKFSSLYHGIWLLLSVLLFPDIMEYVPLSALAAILIVVGYKLAKPSIFLDYWQRGWKQFLPFIVTIVCIVLTDLLIGIGVGFATSLIISLFHHEVRSFKDLREMIRGGERRTQNSEKDPSKQETAIYLYERIGFLSRANLRELSKDIEEEEVVIDLMRVKHIDADGQDTIGELEDLLERQGKHVRTHGGVLAK